MAALFGSFIFSLGSGGYKPLWGLLPHLSLPAWPTNLVLIRAGKKGETASPLEVPNPQCRCQPPSQCSLGQPQAFWATQGRHTMTPTSGAGGKPG